MREFIQEGLTVVKNLSTDLMTADTLPKALSGPAFTRHQIRLMNLSPPYAYNVMLSSYHNIGPMLRVRMQYRIL